MTVPPRQPGRPAAVGAAACISAELLARVAQHELAGTLAVQRRLLAVARARLHAAGVALDELDLAARCTEDAVVVLDALGALAGPTAATGAASCRGAAAPTRLGDVVRRVVRGRGHVAVRLSAPASRSTVDGARAPVMLENLVGNAARHGVAEGTSLHARLDGGHVRLDLRQCGDVPLGVLRALRSAEPPPGRQGLGLWIARRLCDQMGGTVRARAGRGQTWVLRVVLPCPAVPAA